MMPFAERTQDDFALTFQKTTPHRYSHIDRTAQEPVSEISFRALDIGEFNYPRAFFRYVGN